MLTPEKPELLTAAIVVAAPIVNAISQAEAIRHVAGFRILLGRIVLRRDRLELALTRHDGERDGRDGNDAGGTQGDNHRMLAGVGDKRGRG